IPESGDPLYTLFSGTIFESPVYIEFFGIPIILMTYAMSVVPIIIATFFAAKLEIKVAKITPNVLKMFFVPFVVLLIIVPLTLILIGPIATWASQIVGNITLWLYGLSSIAAGAFLGAGWIIFVIFGLHWGLVPIMLNNISVYGMDPLFAILVAHSFALSGAVLAVWIRTKNSKLTALSGPAFLSGFFGISEPALYG